MAFDQAVEDIHVAKHQAGLLGGHHDVFATQLFAGTRGHEQRDNLVEILVGALAQVTGSTIDVGQAQLGLGHAVIAGHAGGGRVEALAVAQAGLTARASTLLGAVHAPALGFLLGAAKQEDRGDQQQAGGQDADAEQCHVGHSVGVSG
ncbi:hypothetical protein D3C71_1601070 [compost metagenome]